MREGTARRESENTEAEAHGAARQPGEGSTHSRIVVVIVVSTVVIECAFLSISIFHKGNPLVKLYYFYILHDRLRPRCITLHISLYNCCL